MGLHESGQMYLEAIYVLGQKSTYVRAIDVGEYLGYSKPSVSRAMANLRRDGYVTVREDGALQLTELGHREASIIYERHDVLTRLLIRLGVDEETASADACKMEHAISEESFEAIVKHMKWADSLQQ